MTEHSCPTCRHAEHSGHRCLNMASDNDCACDMRFVPAMPTEWGVYVPSTASLESGPNVYVLYGDCWRMSPDIGNADQHARSAHERWGLTRLALPERTDVRP